VDSIHFLCERVVAVHDRVPSRWVSLVAAVATLSAGVTVAFAGRLPIHPATSPARPVAAPALALAANVPGPPVGLYYHVGYTVDDLESAMTRFTDAMGVRWRQVQGATLNIRLENGQVKAIELDSVLSMQGPPYIELVRGVQDGSDNPWKASPAFSPAHFGFAVRNLVAHSDALVAAGFPRIATVDVPGVDAAVFAYHRGPGGITIELFDASFAPPGVCDTPDSPFCAD